MGIPHQAPSRGATSAADMEALRERKLEHKHALWSLEENRKNLDPEGSWSSGFWQDRLNYSDEILGHIDEERGILEQELDIAVEAQGPVKSNFESYEIETWRKALRDLPVRKAAEQDMKAFLIRLIDNHRLLMSDEPHRTQFISTFMASSFGTGMSLDYRERPYELRECWGMVNVYDLKLHSIQRGMRKDCIRAYEAKLLPVDDLASGRSGIWDSICDRFDDSRSMVPAYIFSEMHGQELMSKIFGTDDELYTAKNGILISEAWAQYLDTGFFAIVPDVDDLCNRRELRAWERSDPREYKIKILDYNHKVIDRHVHFYDPHPHRRVSRTFRDFDNHRLTFRSSARPRARYVYWQYCLNMLMWSYSERMRRRPTSEIWSERNVLEETQKVFWGSRGTYTQDSWLDALSNELGSRYANDVSNTSSFMTKSCLVASGLITQVVQSRLLPHEKEEQEEYEELVRRRAAARGYDESDSD